VISVGDRLGPRCKAISRLCGFATPATVALAVLALDLLPAGAWAATSTPTPTGRCVSGPCPLNIGGSFSWQDNGTRVSGQFTGSLMALPVLAQVPCATIAGLDSSKAPTIGGLAPHPGLMVPEPVSAPGPGKPLRANIDIGVYHGPGTYTNASLAHPTYAYPAGSQYSTAPVEEADTAWSVTIEADGSGSLTYAGPAQGVAPVGPRPGLQLGQRAQIKFRMVWQCNDAATPVGAAPIHQGTSTTTSEGLPLPPVPGRNGHLPGVSVLLDVAVVVLVLAVIGVVGGWLWRRHRRRRRRPACTCSGHLVISGRNNLTVCECSHLSWRLIVVSRNAVHLVASAPDGRDAFARQYEAQLITECEGAADLQPAVYDWALKATAVSVVLEVTATQVGTCGDGSTCVVTEHATFPIGLRTRPCQVSVVIADHHGLLQVNHAAMRITCGEYDSIFDYGPSVTVRLLNIGGCPGVVECHTSATPDESLGNDLHGFEPGVDLRVYKLPNVTCAMCDALRTYWLGLMAAPGTYNVATNNCVTHVAEALAAVGYPPLTDTGHDPKSPTALERMLSEQGDQPESLPVPR
jgi:hypothetical protein